jgi:hypothetical protein
MGGIALILGLALPASGAAQEPAGSADAAAREHMRQHEKIWRAEARARAEWQQMTRGERRRALRRERRATRHAYLRAQASADAPSDVGSWAPPFVMTSNYRGYAIHAAMLHTGKILMWGYPIHVEKQDAWRGNESYAWLWDPAKGYGPQAVRDVTPALGGQNLSIYCSGMSFLPDGRLLIVGGTLSWGVDDPNDEFTDFAGLNKALIFDPITEKWTDLPRPAGAHGRWYPTQVLLADGRTFVISGFTEEPPGGVLNYGHEIYDATSNSFMLLDSAAQQRGTELYPHMFVMPDGKLLMAGPNTTDSAIFDPQKLASPWTDLPDLSYRRTGGNSVLLPEGPAGSTRVAAIGGSEPEGIPYTPNEYIDLDDTTPAWASFPALHVPRSYPNTVLLPDRSMVTIGGEDLVSDSGRAVELFNPVTGTWRLGPSQVETRAYHSTALLLPDGRVLSTGDDKNPTSNGLRTGASPDDTGEIYSPPYLFKGPRPAIASAPKAVRWNVPFGVGTADKVDRAVLMAPSAVTHSNDMSQRLVPLKIVDRHPGGLTLKSPPSAAVAPPSWYMLFLLKDGVPSVAKWVHLHGAARDVSALPPDATDPRLKLRLSKRGWLGRLRRAGVLRIRVSVNERAKVEARLLRGKRRVARKRVRMRAGTRRLELRPSRRVVEWLRDTRHPRLRLKVVATDLAKNRTARTRALRG